MRSGLSELCDKRGRKGRRYCTRTGGRMRKTPGLKSTVETLTQQVGNKQSDVKFHGAFHSKPVLSHTIQLKLNCQKYDFNKPQISRHCCMHPLTVFSLLSPSPSLLPPPLPRSLPPSPLSSIFTPGATEVNIHKQTLPPTSLPLHCPKRSCPVAVPALLPGIAA